MRICDALGARRVAIVVCVMLASCHSSDESISLDGSSNGRTVSAGVGDQIGIVLQTIGPGQYETPVVSCACIRFLGESFTGPPIPAGPTQLFRFEAVATGTAEIRIPHTIMDPPRPQIAPFVVVIEVH